MKFDREFCEAVMDLRSTGAPYRRFMEALKKVSEKATRDMLAAPSDNVLVAQGRARALSHLIADIENAHAALHANQGTPV